MNIPNATSAYIISHSRILPGPRVSPDAGLLAQCERDEALGPTGMANDELAHPRHQTGAIY
jgi:hypothetical protein